MDRVEEKSVYVSLLRKWIKHGRWKYRSPLILCNHHLFEGKYTVFELCVLCSLNTSFEETHNQSDFQGWENATLLANTEAKRKGEERKRGEGCYEIHQIWWHSDVDNVFCVQLREGKVQHSHSPPPTHYHPPPPSVFNSKQAQCWGFLGLVRSFVPPYLSQRSFLWFSGACSSSSPAKDWTQGGLGKKRGKKVYTITLPIIFLHKYEGKALEKPWSATVIFCRGTQENKCVEEM